MKVQEINLNQAFVQDLRSRREKLEMKISANRISIIGYIARLSFLVFIPLISIYILIPFFYTTNFFGYILYFSFGLIFFIVLSFLLSLWLVLHTLILKSEVVVNQLKEDFDHFIMSPNSINGVQSISIPMLNNYIMGVAVPTVTNFVLSGIPVFGWILKKPISKRVSELCFTENKDKEFVSEVGKVSFMNRAATTSIVFMNKMSSWILNFLGSIRREIIKLCVINFALIIIMLILLFW